MSEMVSFTAGDGQADGYLSRPTDALHAGVVVLQEWWGLVPHIEDIARRFSAQGYLALAPDLYHGKSTVEKEEGACHEFWAPKPSRSDLLNLFFLSTQPSTTPSTPASI